jgi:hypothetical protein
MRALPIVVAAIILTGCGAPADQPAQAGPATTAGLSLADVAGTWENTATLDGVPEPVVSTMSGSAAGDDWTMAFPDRAGIPMLVSIASDSLIGQSAEYESILRPGVMVSVRTASVLQDGELVGSLVATYRTANGEEVVPGALRGVRVR